MVILHDDLAEIQRSPKEFADTLAALHAIIKTSGSKTVLMDLWVSGGHLFWIVWYGVAHLATLLHCACPREMHVVVQALSHTRAHTRTHAHTRAHMRARDGGGRGKREIQQETGQTGCLVSLLLHKGAVACYNC